MSWKEKLWRLISSHFFRCQTLDTYLSETKDTILQGIIQLKLIKLLSLQRELCLLDGCSKNSNFISSRKVITICYQNTTELYQIISRISPNTQRACYLNILKFWGLFFRKIQIKFWIIFQNPKSIKSLIEQVWNKNLISLWNKLQVMLNKIVSPQF